MKRTHEPTMKRTVARVRSISIQFIVIYVVLRLSSFAQMPGCDSTLAPERWSEPEMLPAPINPYRVPVEFPFIAADSKTLYFCQGKTIYKSIISDTGWTSPERLSDNINRGLVQSPALSPDGRKMYFVSWTDDATGWDIWESHWEENINNWGHAVPLDTAINSTANEWTAFISRDGNYMYFSSSIPRDDSYGPLNCYVSKWDSATGNWGPKSGLGYNINYLNFCGSTTGVNYGGVVTADKNTFYYAKDIGSPYNFELYVSYRQKDGTWGKGSRLNINSLAEVDSLDHLRRGTGWDYYPTITPDGRTLYFSSRRNYLTQHWEEKLYVSHLLVDKNGDTVLTNSSAVPIAGAPAISILESYPAPFQSVTMIRYELHCPTRVRINIYDIFGREIFTNDAGWKEAGIYTMKWNGCNMDNVPEPPGLYLCAIITRENTVSLKVIKNN